MFSRGHPDNVLGTSHINLSGKSLERHIRTSQGRQMGRPWDVKSGRLRDGQIGSLGVILGKLGWTVIGTSWGPIFAG